MERPIQSEDKEGNEITKQFTGSDYADMGFGLSIDVGPASVFTESLQMAFVDKLYDSQALDKYQYVKYSPSNVAPTELKGDFEKEAEQIKQQQEEMAQQGTQVDEVMGQLTPEEKQVLQQQPQLMEGL